MHFTPSDTVILIPTYNNAGTLADVVQRALAQGLPVLVVNDGSTDGTAEVLEGMRSPVKPGMTGEAPTDPGMMGEDPSWPAATGHLSVITHPVNRGKGVALKTGFQEARRQGYAYVITLDADGQHHPEDIPLLLEKKGEKTLVVGSRSIRGKDGGSSFANRFSNFWFTLYTWIKLPDTQTGYRLYPLKDLPSLRLLSARYEAELTLLVFSAWKGLRLVPVPVQVEYPEDRVTHFRPGKDFTRISILNTLLLFVAIFYGYPRTLFRKFISLFRKNS